MFRGVCSRPFQQANVFAHGEVVFLDHGVGPSKVRHVLGHMHGGLGIEASEMLEDLESDTIPPVDFRIFHPFAEDRIRVFAIPLKPKDPCHVVDPGHVKVQFTHVGATNITGQFPAGFRHAVTKPRIFDG